MDYSSLYAARIGGPSFGKSGKVYKFTLIKQARDEFVKGNPGVPVIDMGVGEPEERAPDAVVERLHSEALIRENRIYANNGTLPFKEAASRYLRRILGLEFHPEREIVHCIGSKSALALIPMAFVNPGETILATAPGYPVLPSVAQWIGAKVSWLPLLPQNKFLPDLNALSAHCKEQKPKLLLLNYPNNPTGGVATLDFYRRIIELAHEHEFLLVQDAAYSDFVFDGKFVSPLQVEGGREVTIEIYSLSKSFNMQGYRLGFVVARPELLNAFASVKDNTDSGQFIAIQKAGVEALDNCCAFTAASAGKYKSRLAKISAILNQAGFRAEPAAGTFYLYVPMPERFQGQRFETAQALSSFLISRHGIVSVPWDDAGPFLRFSMTFEVGTPNFADEEQVYKELAKRLGSV